MAPEKRRKQQQFSFTWDDEPSEARAGAAETTRCVQHDEQDPPMPPPVDDSPANDSAAEPNSEERPMRPTEEPGDPPSGTDPEPPISPQPGALGTPRARPSTQEDRPKADLSGDAMADLTVGQIMQEARRQVNLTIAQIAQRTRIPPSFLYSIEADQLDRLPALIYSKSHVRQLCRDYGLDPEAVLEKFLAAVDSAPPKRKTWNMKIRAGGDDDSSRVAYHLPPDEEIEGVSRQLNWPVLISGAALALLALIVIIAVVAQLRGGGEEAPEPATAPGATIDYEEFVLPEVLPLKQMPMPGQ